MKRSHRGFMGRFVMKKFCSKCISFVELINFNHNKSNSTGYQTICKKCESQNQKIRIIRKYYENLNDKPNKLYLKKICPISSFNKIIKAYSRKRKKIKIYLPCDENIISKEDRRKIKSSLYYELNKNKIKQRNYQYIVNKRKEDLLFRLKESLRKRISKALKGKGIKNNNKINGIDVLVIKKHIERQFKKGMSWDNYGEWHIDHIIPMSFAKDEKTLIELNHYKNLQPLWAFDNLSKHSKITETQLYIPI